MKNQTNFLTYKTVIMIFFFSVFIPNQPKAQINDKNIEVGKIITISSKVLNEDRNIFVYLPVGYDRTEEKYPVIYILDGRGNFVFASAIANFLSRIQRMPRSIVVGIPNTDRTRDFTPSNVNESQNSGGADKFLEFMESELIPHINENYRTHSYRTLFGHSLCGMFAIYTLFEKPEMFNSSIAVSPYLQYDNQYVVQRVDSILTERTEFENDLFITLGNEPEYTESIKLMEELLLNKTNNLSWEISIRESEDHNSVPLKSLYDGLEFIYSDWPLSNETIEKGIKAIKNHYSKISEKYGFAVNPTEASINVIGYQHLAKNEYKKAIEVFEYNVELHPKSANVYDSLGETMEKVGRTDEAIENYRTAVKLGTINNDINLRIYQQNLERVESAKI